MTPFEAYFAANIAPALEGAPPAAVKLAKASAADIWNAAIEQAGRILIHLEPNNASWRRAVGHITAATVGHPYEIGKEDAARVTP